MYHVMPYHICTVIQCDITKYGMIINHYMGVSENSGTPKSSILIGFSITFSPSILGYPYFWKHPYIRIPINKHDFHGMSGKMFWSLLIWDINWSSSPKNPAWARSCLKTVILKLDLPILRRFGATKLTKPREPSHKNDMNYETLFGYE